MQTPEKEEKIGYNSEEASIHQGGVDEDHLASGKVGIFEKMNNFMNRLGGEVRGVEQIPEDERHDDSYWNSLSMWLGSNLVIASFALGVLGRGIFHMAFWDATLTIIFFNIFGCVLVAFFSCAGPETGLRAMVTTRYWFGFQTARICALINMISCVGWSSVNTIASANSLHVVNNGGMPVWAAVFMIAMASLLVAMFGYNVVHKFEMYAWIPNFFCLIVIAARMGKSHQFTWGTMATGRAEAGNVLSFGGIIFGFAAGWAPFSSDYTSYKPKHTSKVKLFFGLLLGEGLPSIFTMIMGAACATGMDTNPEWATLYEEKSVGGLLYAVLCTDVGTKMSNFGQFVIVLFALSTVANNVPNMYTFALSAQAIWDVLKYVPRYLWTVLMVGITIAVAIPGASNFEEALSKFMNYISYWVGFYAGVCMSEHFVYRRGNWKNYDFTVANDAKKMPWGIAGLVGGCMGAVGAWLGMSQTDYVGPVAKAITKPVNDFGGDIGWQLALSFGFVGHCATRWLELRWDHWKSFPQGVAPDGNKYHDAEEQFQIEG